jgi:transposase
MLALSSGNEADVSLAKELTEYLPPGSIVIADKAYDSCPFREAAATNGIKTSIPGRSNRTTGVPFSAKLYRHRHRIENFFQRLSATVELLPATTNSPKPSWVLSASPCCSP